VPLAVIDVAEKVGDAFAIFARLAWQREARQLRAAVLVEDDQVVSLAGGEPVAVGRARFQDVLFLTQSQHPAHHRAQFLSGPSQEILQGSALFPESPLELIE